MQTKYKRIFIRPLYRATMIPNMTLFVKQQLQTYREYIARDQPN